MALEWLGWQDSNLRMPGSKPGALPLGDTPTENEKPPGNFERAIVLIRTCPVKLQSTVS